MGRVRWTFLFLGTLLLAWVFPAWAQTYDSPQVIVSVYDDAGVSERTLAQVEEKVARVFKSAGLDVVWKTCSSRSTKHVDPDVLVRAAGEQSSPGSGFEKTAGLHPAGQVVVAPASTWSVPGCGQFESPTHLAVRIVAKSKQGTSDVFGEAFLSAEGTGCYSDVFYDRAVSLNSDWHVSLTDILGNVMAHELGHLLLGSNSHTATGIMRARWQAEELRRAGEGSLLFNAEQAERMRGKLRAATSQRTVAAR